MARSSSPPLSDSSPLDSAADSPEDDRPRHLHGGSEAGPSGSGKQRKKFHPFRAVRNIFRRAKRQGSEDDLHAASKKSRSTSELNSSSTGLHHHHHHHATSPAAHQQQHRGYGSSGLLHPDSLLLLPGGGVGPNGGGLHAGLSVSHDSIFASEPALNGSAALQGGPGGTGHPGSALSVPALKSLKDELRARLRGRRDSDEEDDDPGLPHSPCTSPTTADVLAQGLKDKSSKSHSSTCSAGSLISMCSSENDEEMSGLFSSGHSSRRSTDFDGGELDVSQPVPLNHNAALHKMAVRPKRTHGLPRHRRMQQMALAAVGQSLPATPEVTEDSSLSSLLQAASDLMVAPSVEVTLHDDPTASEGLDEFMDVTTSIYCTSPTENVETEEVEPVVEISLVEPVPESVVETLSEPPISGEGTSLEPDVEDREVPDPDLPPVKPPKSKSKSAKLKFEHEVKQFSKRQQERLRDSDSELCDSPDINQNFGSERVDETTETSETKEVERADLSAVVDMATGSSDTKESTNVEQEVKPTEVFVRNEKVAGSKETSVPAEEPETGKPSYFVLESVSESLMNVFFGNDAAMEPVPPEPMHVSEITLVDPEVPFEPKQTVPTATEALPKMETPDTTVDIEEGVVLRHPERASLIHHAPDRPPRASDSDGGTKLKAETDPKLVEPAFSSGDFAGIMKKRRSMTDSSVPGDLQNVSSRRPVSEDVRKLSTPSKRLSVEITPFDERLKELPIVKVEEIKKEEELSSMLNPEPNIEKPVSPVELPVTIRVRREKSLSERSSDIPSEVSSNEKPVVRPRSQVFNPEEPPTKSKVPEFMKIQLRSSREELDSCKSEPKSESVVAAQPPHWEVKIQPQKSQRKLSSGPASLPYIVGKPPTSPEVKAEPEIKREVKATPQKEMKSDVTKDVESRVKLPLQKLDAKPDLPMDPEQQRSKPTSHKPDTRTEVSRDTELRPKQAEERLRQDDSSKPKRNSSSENKENVAVSNVQNDLIERRISVDESRQEQSGDKSAGTDNRRRSYVLPKEVEDHEPELFRVFARRSIKQKHPDKSKKDEPPKEEANPRAEENTTKPKPEVVATKPDGVQTPVKPKVETKLFSEEKTPPKRVESFTSKPSLRDHSKPLEKIVMPHSLESTPVKPVSPSSSPKLPCPDIVPLKPERRESFKFRNKAPDSSETKIDKPILTKDRSYTDPIKPPSYKSPDVPVGKIERRESASFKVRPSENVTNKSPAAKNSPKIEPEPPKAVLATKRAEFVKMASLDSSNPKDGGGKDAPTWLQLAQQRREKREQKERMLYGQNSNSFVLEGSNKPSRNSKVLDLVNNFQKLQTT